MVPKRFAATRASVRSTLNLSVSFAANPAAKVWRPGISRETMPLTMVESIPPLR